MQSFVNILKIVLHPTLRYTVANSEESLILCLEELKKETLNWKQT